MGGFYSTYNTQTNDSILNNLYVKETNLEDVNNNLEQDVACNDASDSDVELDESNNKNHVKKIAEQIVDNIIKQSDNKNADDIINSEIPELIKLD